MTVRALEVREQYAAFEERTYGRQWSLQDLALGLVGDVGDLVKLVQAHEGVRAVRNARPALEHELADVLWSLLVIAKRRDVDSSRRSPGRWTSSTPLSGARATRFLNRARARHGGARSRGHEVGTEASHTRHDFLSTVGSWRRRGAFSSGSSGSSPCDGRTRARSSSSRSSALFSGRQRHGRERREVMPDRAPSADCGLRWRVT